jgi:hypothetical protein
MHQFFLNFNQSSPLNYQHFLGIPFMYLHFFLSSFLSLYFTLKEDKILFACCISTNEQFLHLTSYLLTTLLYLFAFIFHILCIVFFSFYLDVAFNFYTSRFTPYQTKLNSSDSTLKLHIFFFF